MSQIDWLVMSYVWMPNHIHLLLKTPQPNLSAGMQYLVSGYANWFFKRHQRPGHLFQGRFRSEHPTLRLEAWWAGARILVRQTVVGWQSSCGS